MRFLFAAFLLLAVCLALPIPPTDTFALAAEQTPAPQALEVLSYSHNEASAEFSIHCEGCALDAEADESLIFRFQARSTPAHSSDLSFVLNDVYFTYPLDDTSDSFSYAVPVSDSSGNVRTVTLHWSLCPLASVPDEVDPGTQLLHFTVGSIDTISDPKIAFSIGMDVKERQPRLSEIFSSSTTDLLRFSESDDTITVVDLAVPPIVDDATQGSTTFNITGELEYLRHLEQQATELRTQIATAKAFITNKLRQNRNGLCLKHLIKQCNGVVCSARIIAQRICDKMGINVDPAFGYTSWETAGALDHQHFLTDFGEKIPHLPDIDSNTYTIDGLKGQLFTSEQGRKNTVFFVLAAFASFLGLTSLFLLIRKRCASARTRAERAADREERRNRRTYRRAARRALIRKRWQDFISSLNCFRLPIPSSKQEKDQRTEDYEEKRALILQEAFLEQDLDVAEKGQVMEAEIRELRHAHEIVASLVRVDDETTHDHAPRYALLPPPQHPEFPNTPTTARSRAASSYTLPSYTSETLPDYQSRYSGSNLRLSNDSTSNAQAPCYSSDDEDSTHFTPSTSSESGAAASRSENSGSSVIDVSTRPSGETLRTGRFSVETIGN